MIKKAFLATCLSVCISAPTLAEPTLGFGLNVAFGQNPVDAGFSVRIFSEDKPNRPGASLGVDYMTRNKTWRAAAGLAYMFDDSYVELNRGFDYGARAFNYGFGIGSAETE